VHCRADWRRVVHKGVVGDDERGGGVSDALAVLAEDGLVGGQQEQRAAKDLECQERLDGRVGDERR
jgi:hypothetical protein